MVVKAAIARDEAPMVEQGDFVFRVARRIAACRRERGLSQEGLAALLDIAVKNVQRIEAGKQNLSLRTLERISIALQTSPEDLVAGTTTGGEGTGLSSVLDRLERGGFRVRRASERGRRSPAAVAVTTLRAAAGHLSGAARAIEVVGWVVVPRRGAPPAGQFVAEVRGTSMSPLIPDRAICLFGPAGPGPLEGRTLLVAHESLADEELGGPYALKRVRSVKRRDGRTRVVLESVDPSHPPIVVDAAEGELRVIAELVRVLLP